MDFDEIRKWHSIFKPNNELFEIRVLGDKTYSAYFTDIEEAIKQLPKYDNSQIYFTVNKVNDACASRKKDNFKNAIRLMRQNGAKIADTEIVLFELLKTSKHPNFKDVQALIK